MKDVLEYTNYRQYIADYYAEKKAKSAFTWQEFTRAAGFSSPVHLKYASEGRLNLSDTAAKRVAQAMHLVDFEQERDRLTKQRKAVEKDLAKVSKKLENPGYLAKAAQAWNADEREPYTLAAIKASMELSYYIPLFDCGFSIVASPDVVGVEDVWAATYNYHLWKLSWAE